MLGRTDSRRRLLVLLVVFVVGSLALTAGWRTGRSSTASGSPRRRWPRRRSTSRRPANAATSSTGAGRSCWPRPCRASASSPTPAQLPRTSGGDRHRADPDPGARRGRQHRAARQARRAIRKYLILALRARPRGRRPDPGGARRPARLRPDARTRTRAGLPAGRRRPGLDPRRAPARLRQSRGHRPVRRRAGLPVGAGRRAARPRRPARRERPADHRRGDRRRSRACPARTCA